MKVDGLHHVTAITADIDANLAFYGQLLGLRLVWQGVDADDPGVRHIAYGDERGSPGSIVTFFDMPGVMRGRPGAGMVHQLLLRVGRERALDFWERRLARAGVPGDRLPDRLAFADPEGLALELVTDDGEDEPLVADAPDVDGRVAIRGMHGVRAYSADPSRSASVFGELLGMEPAGEARWLAQGERRQGLVVYDPAPAEAGIMGVGTVHHVAFTIRDGEQDAWRSRIAAAGLRPTPVLDRKMTKSVYFREPGRVLLEVATDQPGFVFEPPEHLGESLVLIGDLGHRRAELERRFPLLPNPRAGM
ncbi:MAG: glyoxalase family protein [Solirubrobacteraceae bacterium]|jgi:glyoxalase family protein|nr:glyoxalase family protein [Solirubrobacteraceae bacterium]